MTQRDQETDMKSEQESKKSSRRRFLQVVGVGAVGIAGCLGDDGSTDDDGNDPTDTETGTATPVTETPTDEPTDSTDDASTATDTPTDQETDEEDDQAVETELPLTGARVPELSAFDESMVSFMEQFDIGAGALGVAHEGNVVLERGYGWADDAETNETALDSFFRIGSVSKSLTQAAVYELVQAGDISYDDRVLPLLSVDPPGGEPADDRFGEITVRHLVDHQAGLVPGGNPEFQDPVFVPRAVAEHLGIERPPTTEDFVRYLLDRDLEYDPGTPADELSFDPYSNVGYVVLTQLVAAVTGQSYQSYLESAWHRRIRHSATRGKSRTTARGSTRPRSTRPATNRSPGPTAGSCSNQSWGRAVTTHRPADCSRSCGSTGSSSASHERTTST
jgi:hypothetical protein